MKFFGVLFLSLCYAIDLSGFLAFSGSVRISLSLLFLYFLSLRFHLVQTAFFVLVYAFFVHGMSWFGLPVVFFSIFFGMAVLFLVRHHLFMESYLVQSIWVLLLFLNQDVLLLLFKGEFNRVIFSSDVVNLLLRDVMNAAISIFYYRFLDLFFDRVEPDFVRSSSFKGFERREKILTPFG